MTNKVSSLDDILERLASNAVEGWFHIEKTIDGFREDFLLYNTGEGDPILFVLDQAQQQGAVDVFNSALTEGETGEDAFTDFLYQSCLIGTFHG